MYVVSCGHLGTEPDILGERLHELLLRVANWRIVLLLDEVDFFLCDRKTFDIRHSALLSVFRYQLEQSEALVFMTATWCGTPDRYFTSRMNLALGLPPLSPRYQKEIWMDLIGSLKLKSTVLAEEFIRSELMTLGSGRAGNMNGLQIQACLRAALALAKQSGKALDGSHIKRVIELSLEFKDFVARQPREDRNGALLNSYGE